MQDVYVEGESVTAKLKEVLGERIGFKGCKSWLRNILTSIYLKTKETMEEYPRWRVGQSRLSAAQIQYERF